MTPVPIAVPLPRATPAPAPGPAPRPAPRTGPRFNPHRTSTSGALKEYYLPIDVQVGARAGILALSDRGDLATKLAVGGGVTVGFGAASYLAPVSELWLRVTLGYFAGGSRERFFVADVGPEATAELGGGLAFSLGAGLSALTATKSASPSETSTNWTGTSIGTFARASLEQELVPDLSLGLTVEGRTGFMNTKLENGGTPDTNLNAGRLLGGLGLVTLSYTF